MLILLELWFWISRGWMCLRRRRRSRRTRCLRRMRGRDLLRRGWVCKWMPNWVFSKWGRMFKLWRWLRILLFILELLYLFFSVESRWRMCWILSRWLLFKLYSLFRVYRRCFTLCWANSSRGNWMRPISLTLPDFDWMYFSSLWNKLFHYWFILYLLPLFLLIMRWASFLRLSYLPLESSIFIRILPFLPIVPWSSPWLKQSMLPTLRWWH